MYFILKGADFSTANLGKITVVEGSVGTGGTTIDPNAKYTLTVTPTPSDATVVLTPEGGSAVTGTTIEVTRGTKVTIELSKTGYVSQTFTTTVYSDKTYPAQIFAESVKTYTLTINPNPASATVIIDGTERKTITVAENSRVSWSVSASGYESQSDVWLATENKTLNVTLVANGDSGGGTLITSGSLAGAYLYENYQFEGATQGSWTGLKQDTTNAYFVYDKIPITPGYTINAPKGRAFYFSTSNGSVISGATQNNFTKINYETTIPSNAAFISICYKYVDIQPSAVNVTISAGFGSPTTTLLKDSGATYMAETAIESNKTEPTAYSNYYTYHLIPVTGGNKYKLENCRLSIWYDTNKEFISQVNFNINSSIATTTDWSHVAPNDAAYLSVCVKVGDIDKDSVAIVEYPKL